MNQKKNHILYLEMQIKLLIEEQARRKQAREQESGVKGESRWA